MLRLRSPLWAQTPRSREDAARARAWWLGGQWSPSLQSRDRLTGWGAAARSRPCCVLSRLWRSHVLLCAPGQVAPDAGVRRRGHGAGQQLCASEFPGKRPWRRRLTGSGQAGLCPQGPLIIHLSEAARGWPGGQAARPTADGRAGPGAERLSRAGPTSARVRELLLPPPPDTHAPGSALRSSRCSLRALRLCRSAALGGPGRPAVPWAFWRCSHGCGRPQLTPGTFRGSALDVGWARVSLRPLECVRGSDQPPSRAHARVREREGGAARPLSSHSKRPRYRSLAGKASGESRPDPTAGGGSASHWSRDGLSAKGSQARTGDKRSHSRAAQRASAWLTG